MQPPASRRQLGEINERTNAFDDLLTKLYTRRAAAAAAAAAWWTGGKVLRVGPLRDVRLVANDNSAR